MRSLNITVVDERRKTLVDAPPTAHPQEMELVNSHIESMKLLFDVVSVGVLELTAHPN